MTISKPTIWLLIANAHEAGKAVDYFDLHSEDPASKAEWADLVKAQDDALLALVQYVHENGGTLPWTSDPATLLKP